MTDQVSESKPTASPEGHGRARQSLVLPIVLPIAILLIIGLVLFGFSRVLLSVSARAATLVALIVAASIMAVATFVASRSRISNASLFSMVGAIALSRKQITSDVIRSPHRTLGQIGKEVEPF